jgi:hypothetical protein
VQTQTQNKAYGALAISAAVSEVVVVAVQNAMFTLQRASKALAVAKEYNSRRRYC